MMDSLTSRLEESETRILNGVEQMESQQLPLLTEMRKKLLVKESKVILKSLSNVDMKVTQELKDDSLAVCSKLDSLDHDIEKLKVEIR